MKVKTSLGEYFDLPAVNHPIKGFRNCKHIIHSISFYARMWYKTIPLQFVVILTVLQHASSQEHVRITLTEAAQNEVTSIPNTL